MSKITLVILLCAALLFSAPAFAVDGQTLINQSTVVAAGGFPYNISQPGSYKLSGNLIVPASANGIEINAAGVVLDLNGFTILGPIRCNGSFSTSATSCTGTGFGIGISNQETNGNVTVKNGSVVGFGVGILGGGGFLVEEVHATDNSTAGIQVDRAIVRRCIADNNGTGFQLNGNAVAENNEASINASAGLVSRDGGIVIGNVLNFNGGTGLEVEKSLYGSNSIQHNAGGDIFLINAGTKPSVSQNNNICTSGPC
jgi:hypothetical protein